MMAHLYRDLVLRSTKRTWHIMWGHGTMTVLVVSTEIGGRFLRSCLAASPANYVLLYQARAVRKLYRYLVQVPVGQGYSMVAWERPANKKGGKM